MNMQDKELFAAMLYTCYDLIKPDVALEVAWRCDLQEFVMPYFIQFVKDLSSRVETVQKNNEDIKKKEEAKAEEMGKRQLDVDMTNFMFPGMQQQNQGPLAIGAPAGSMPPMNGMASAMGGAMNNAINNAMGGMNMGTNMGGGMPMGGMNMGGQPNFQM